MQIQILFSPFLLSPSFLHFIFPPFFPSFLFFIFCFKPLEEVGSLITPQASCAMGGWKQIPTLLLHGRLKVYTLYTQF